MKPLYNSDTVYYIKYKGEIYECKFTSILVKIPTIEELANPISSNIVQINLDIPNGHVGITYSRWLSSTEWAPFDIYSSIEDCIAKRNPLFTKEARTWDFNTPLPITYKDLEDSKVIWVKKDTGEGYILAGWRYSTESYTAKRLVFSSHKSIKNVDGDLTYDYPIYDIINKCWWGDPKWLANYYSTKGDCLSLNAPVIHRF